MVWTVWNVGQPLPVMGTFIFQVDVKLVFIVNLGFVHVIYMSTIFFFLQMLYPKNTGGILDIQMKHFNPSGLN